MFNPTSLDKVCVQAMHLEAGGKNKDKNSKGKGKKNAFVKQEGETVIFKHC